MMNRIVPAAFAPAIAVLAAVLTALTVAAQTAPGADAAAKKEATRVQKTERLKPSGIGEYCVALAVGQVVRYRFEAEAPVDFNIHMHRGEEVIYALQQEAVTRIEFVDFKPEQASDWCWMWTNKNATQTDVRYTVFVAPPKREKKK